MSFLRNVVIAILGLSFFTFIALFGQLPALRKTPIGWLQRAMCIRLPKGLRYVDQRLTKGKISSKTEKFGNYLFYEKNPAVLVCRGLFLWQGLGRLPLSLAAAIPIFLVPPYIFTYLAATAKSLYIVPSNHAVRSLDYPYDHLLFRPNTFCRTCNFTKPARSKHCSLCNVCVAACDHHCPWIHNCVGRGNYRYFLGLLLSLGFLQLYGSYLCWFILEPSFSKGRSRTPSNATFWTSLGNGFVYAVNAGGLSIAGVGMLAAATACLPFGLFVYHCYLIWAGMTTNESQKWSDFQLDMKDGIVFRTSRSRLKAHNDMKKQNHAPSEDGYTDELNPALSVDEHHDVPWPVSTNQVVVSTMDGKPPYGQETLWTQVWGLHEVDNIYDLGGWNNLMEILRGR
nr:palmitoyltransferase swf1 [Quercus suber]